MNPTIQAIMERRSIRKYEDRPITDETMAELFKVIEGSQSWNNTQCWEVVEIKDEKTRKQLQAAVNPKNPSNRAIVNAPRLLALCARKGLSGRINNEVVNKHGDWYMYDMGIMTQNLCLAAHALGLGSVVVSWMDVDAAEKVLNCPEKIELITLIPLGYRAQKGHAPKHKAVEDFLHTDTF